jgi:transposase-like protein
VLLLTKTRTHLAEVNSKQWSSETSARGASPSKYKKNGPIYNGKQNHQCHDCGRPFVDCFAQYLISEDTPSSH